VGRKLEVNPELVPLNSLHAPDVAFQHVSVTSSTCRVTMIYESEVFHSTAMYLLPVFIQKFYCNKSCIIVRVLAPLQTSDSST
jgi:hypothetical protein